MPPSIVEKYEQILAADPRSRIFVELARALLERGQPERTIQVCQQGLEHHPSSILGRVVWGRALLERGDPPGAMDQFEIAIALDPTSPYAFNLVGDALIAKELYRDALPVLARAAELQPADTRVRLRLEEARRRAAESAPVGTTAPRAPAADCPAADEVTEPYRPIAQRPAPPVLERRAASDADQTGPVPLPRPPAELLPGGVRYETAAVAPGARGASASQPANAIAGAVPGPLPGRAGGATGSPTTSPALANGRAAPGAAPAAAAGPPPLRLGASAFHRDEIPHSLLAMIPGAGRAGARSAPAAPDEAEAERIAADFEREVRERLLSAPEPAPSPLQRHRRLLLPALAGLVVAAAAGVYLYVDSANASQLSATAATRARAGLARDTVGALREAARLLGEARRRASRPELDSLAAQVAAVLASEHGDAAARTLAAELAGSGSAGDGALVARCLLAATPAERAAAEAGVLVAPPSSEPLVQALAGRILISRGEVDAGRGRLEIAAHASPPLLRALSDLGDSALAGDDPEGALALYSAALSAHPTHPRAATGAAEARLELGRELDRSRLEFAAIDADPASAPPRDLAVRYEIAHARVLAATGDGAEAARRLSRAAARLGETPELLTATVEVHLAARAWDRAEAAAARAVALSPRDARARVLLARARIGRSRFAEALAATGSFGDRAVRLQRAIARFRLGQIPEARAELEHIARGGRMPAEAAIWYALTDVQLGRPERARTVLEKLAAAKSPPPLLAVALGQALEAEGKLAEAEQAYRASVARDPAAPEGRAALGSFLLARGDFAGALRELEQAVGADPAGFDARRALGAARLAAGHPAQARAELDAVLLARPADLEALRLLSAAWLAEGQPQEARRAAGRGLARAPRHVGLLVAAARAALAQGDRAAAKGLSDRAVRSAGHGAQAPEARTLAAEVGRRKG